MTRWLWIILVAYLMGTSVSAMLFDRIDHQEMERKDKWSVIGYDIRLSNARDFLVYATPMVGTGLLACALFAWVYAGSQRNAVSWTSKLPPVGPDPGRSAFQKRLDAIVRAVVASVSLGFGGYASVHLFRHLLKHSVFDHTTKQVFHGPGLAQHLSHWSLNGDLRYGIPEGITYYAGIQSAGSLLLLTLGLFFGAWGIKRVFR